MNLETIEEFEEKLKNLEPTNKYEISNIKSLKINLVFLKTQIREKEKLEKFLEHFEKLVVYDNNYRLHIDDVSKILDDFLISKETFKKILKEKRLVYSKTKSKDKKKGIWFGIKLKD